MGKEELVRLVTIQVVEALLKGPSIPIGLSNRHVHLCREDMDAMFGVGSELTKMRGLKQPGQFACEETVTIRGPKGELSKVRVLGPLRPETQVEISATDGYLLGVRAPVRESGRLDKTPGIELIGPNGSVKKSSGVIMALRHIHMSAQDARMFGVKDGETVCVTLGDDIRRAIFKNVLIRVSDKYELEMHVDIDEGNAVGARNGDYAAIYRK